MATIQAVVPTPAPAPKRPPQKKRHTKPCRYYQVGTCPHTAQEDCDFAHVYSDQMPPTATVAEPKQCRYWAQGNCTNGIWCQYKHGDADDAALLEEYRKLTFAGHGMAEFAQPTSPNASAIPSSGFHATYMSPSPGLWSPYAYSESYGYPRHPLSMMTTPSASPTHSESASTSSDESSAGEHGLQQQYPAPVSSPSSYFAPGGGCPGPYVVPVSPGYGPMPSPYSVSMDAYPMSPMSPVFRMHAAPLYDIFGSTHPQMPMQIHRPKMSSYRTKACRYYKSGSVCPNGDECTFIHADPDPMSSNDDDVPSTPESPSPPPSTRDSLPARPISQREEDTRRGYFPISWRVIGGGVLCGGGGKESSDVDSLSEDSSSIDDVLYSIPPGLGGPTRTESVNIPVVFPSIAPVEEDMMSNESTTPTGAARQRASSIPSTPINGHVDVLRLFSAESPGGL
ncbi:hypothetical protein C8F01DRAFT_1113121 [Mycena amicta]|nr:hypothetical protein C8F01DRAFT_1113121 [Mycena amicta]